MLSPPYIEDYFVLSMIHDYPFRNIALESYIVHFTNLIVKSIDKVKDKRTKEYLRNAVVNAEQSYTNLGKEFFQTAKIRFGLNEKIILWPKDFPTFRILGVNEPTLKWFTHKETAFFVNLRKGVRKRIRQICNEYNPLLLIAVPTIQMRRALSPISTETENLFKEVWKGEKPSSIKMEEISKFIFREGLPKFKEIMMNESYRQVLLSQADLQRGIRKRLCELCSRGNGERELISDYVFLQLFECLFMDYYIERIISMMKDLHLPILILEDDKLSLFLTSISKQAKVPFQEELDMRQKRYLLQLTSSKAFAEADIPYVHFFEKSLSLEESKLLSLLWDYLESLKMVPFPIKQGVHFFDILDIEEEVIEEWIDGPKSPFIKVVWRGKDWRLCTKMILEDKIFRLAWFAHKATLFKLRGVKFEDFVLSALKEVFPSSLVGGNKYFWGVYEGRRKRLEIDRFFVLNDVFYVIECKNLMFIEDTSNFKKLTSRESELKAYGEYLYSKAKLLTKNFDQLEKKIPTLIDYNCSRIAPLILSAYPDIIAFYKVPFVTIYEFVRFLHSLKYGSSHEALFRDTSGVKFSIPTYKISQNAL